jgi:tetratricopeptide (TPR) repeat protein
MEAPEETAQHVMVGAGMAAMLAGRRDFRGQLLQAEYWQYEKNWERAFETYKNAFVQMEDRSPPEQREVFMGISRCFYEMGKYVDAIEIGQVVIEMNRHFPGAHKYVALAQKAQGDYDGAKATMTRAVLYETPWDDNNIKANRALLREMQHG